MWDGWVDVEYLYVYLFGYWNYVLGMVRMVIVVFSVCCVWLMFNGWDLGMVELVEFFLFCFEGVCFEFGELCVIGLDEVGVFVCEDVCVMVGVFVVLKFIVFIYF